MPENRIKEEFEKELKLKFKRLPYEQLLRLTEVETIVGLKKSKLYALIKEDRFPQPVTLGTRSVRWRASTIYGWIDGLSSANITGGASA